MTEEQLVEWKSKRDAARRIKDPRARAAALAIVHDMKDDMRMECQRKMADRIKELRASDKEQSDSLVSIKETVEQVKRDFAAHLKVCEADHETVEEVRKSKLKAIGAMTLLKWLGYLAAAGGGSAVTLLINMARQAGGAT